MSFLDGGPKERYTPMLVSPNTPIKSASTKEKAGDDVSIEFEVVCAYKEFWLPINIHKHNKIQASCSSLLTGT